MLHPNNRTYTIKLKRRDVCALLVACTCAMWSDDTDSEKWGKLHYEIKKQLDKQDVDNGLTEIEEKE